MSEQVRENLAMSRFELPIENDVMAAAYYKNEDGRVVLTHTEVPQEYSGQGIGSRLAEGVFALLKRRGIRVIAKCPFMASFAARHPEFNEMLDG